MPASRLAQVFPAETQLTLSLPSLPPPDCAPFVQTVFEHTDRPQKKQGVVWQRQRQNNSSPPPPPPPPLVAFVKSYMQDQRDSLVNLYVIGSQTMQCGDPRHGLDSQNTKQGRETQRGLWKTK